MVQATPKHRVWLVGVSDPYPPPLNHINNQPIEYDNESNASTNRVR